MRLSSLGGAAVFITGILAPLVAGPNKGVAAAIASLIWILGGIGHTFAGEGCQES